MSSIDELLSHKFSAEQSQAKLLQALTNWQKPNNDLTPFTGLRLFRQALRTHNGNSEWASRQVLRQALVLLAHTHPDHAQVVQSRLLTKEKIQVALRRLHLSEANFHRKRQEGLALLSTVLLRLEEEAQQRHSAQMVQRLEPPTYTHLIGKEEALQTLAVLLVTSHAPWLIALVGIGGIGKTTLADLLARRMIAHTRWDGIGWVTARQTLFTGVGIRSLPHPALTTHALVDALTTQLLGEASHSVLRTNEEAVALLEQHLKNHPHLIVIDNLETVVDLEQLLPILRRLANPSKFLITTRVSLLPETDLYHRVVSTLAEADALALLHHEARIRNIPQVTAASDADLQPIFATVGGNPLALRLIAGQLRIHPLTAVLTDLLAANGGGKPALYTYIYQRAWDLLDPPARDLLVAMTLVSPQGGSLTLLAAMGNPAPHELSQALDTLVTLNLVEVRGDLHEKQYTIHGLTRAFLQRQIIGWQPGDGAPVDKPSWRDQEKIDPNHALYAGKLQHYLVDNVAFVQHLVQADDSLLSDALCNQALHTLGYALSVPETWLLTYDLLLALAPKLEQADLRDEWIPYLEKGIVQAQALGDEPAAAELNLHLGYLLQLRNKHQTAHACFSASATTFAAVDDKDKLARALNRLAFLCRLQPALGDPVALAQRALTLLSPAHPERAASCVALGWHAYDHRDWPSAVAYFEHALAIAQQQEHPRQIARRLRDLASAWQMQGKYQAAIDCYEQAIARFAVINDAYDQAVAHMNVGVAYLALQEAQTALDWFALAEPIFVRVQDQLHLAMLYNNRGIALRRLAQWTEAEAAFLHSITLNEQIDNRREWLNVTDELAMTYLHQGKTALALVYLRKALDQLPQITADPAYPYWQEKITAHWQQALTAQDNG